MSVCVCGHERGCVYVSLFAAYAFVATYLHCDLVFQVFVLKAPCFHYFLCHCVM